MNFARIGVATVAGFLAYFIVGSAIFVLAPQVIEEGRKYAGIFRSREGQMARMPAIMVATLIAIFILSLLYANGYHAEYGAIHGLHFGLLIAGFVVSAFVVHNHVNLNVGLKLTVMQGVAYFVQWTAVGTVIGLIYR